MTIPRVSVLMPVHNGERFLREAIDSILFQTYEDFELIVANDGSTDSTASILNTYSDPRIRIIKNEKKSGLANVRNQLIGEAKGELLCWLDADDIAERKRLWMQVDHLDRNPNVVLVCTNACTIDEHGRRLNMRWWSTKGETAQLEMLWSNPIAQSSVMVRKAYLFDYQLLYDPSCPPAEDYDLFTRLSMHGRIDRIDTVLLRYRISSTGAFSSNREKAFTISVASNEKLIRRITGHHIEDSHYELLPWPNPCKSKLEMGKLTDWLLFLIEKGCLFWDFDWTLLQRKRLAQSVLCRYIFRRERRGDFVKNMISLCRIFGVRVVATCSMILVRIVMRRGGYL